MAGPGRYWSRSQPDLSCLAGGMTHCSAAAAAASVAVCFETRVAAAVATAVAVERFGAAVRMRATVVAAVAVVAGGTAAAKAHAVQPSQKLGMAAAAAAEGKVEIAVAGAAVSGRAAAVAAGNRLGPATAEEPGVAVSPVQDPLVAVQQVDPGCVAEVPDAVRVPGSAAGQRVHYLLSTPAAVTRAAPHGRQAPALGPAEPGRTEAAAVGWAPVIGGGRYANMLS